MRARDGSSGHPRAHAALVALVAASVHVRTAAFGFTGLDDRDLVVDDQAFLADPASLLRVFGRAYMHVVDPAHGYYRPLVAASFVADAQWSGARPLGYHVTNVVLHALASVLVWALLRRFELRRGIALGAALVFAVLPTFASVVAWIPGRNDSLLVVFALGSWIFFARDRARPSWRDRAAHLALFAAALATKETALALPLVWTAQVVLVESGGWARARGLASHGLAWTALGAARIALHPPGLRAGLRDVAPHLPQLVTALGSIALPLRPRVLAVTEDLSLAPGFLALLAIVAGTWLVTGVRRRVVAFGMLAFVLLVLPSLVLPGTLVLDSRLYLPAVGVLLAMATIVQALAIERRILLASAAVTIGALALLTVAFEGAYRDPRAFAREAVSGSPHAPLAHFCLGQTYQLAGQDDRALAEYRAALALAPAEVVHNDIAVIAMKRARWGEAERELGEELAINPRFARAHYNLGIVLRREGRAEESCAAEERALALSPDDDRIREERARDCDTFAPIPR